jgi:hypothetical protein
MLAHRARTEERNQDEKDRYRQEGQRVGGPDADKDRGRPGANESRGDQEGGSGCPERFGCRERKDPQGKRQDSRGKDISTEC